MNPMKKMFVFATVAFFLFSCGNGNQGKAPAADSLQGAPIADTSSVSAQFFGEKITDEGAISLSELKTQMGDKKEMNVKLVGEIESVCQKKGCWMKIKNDAGDIIHVTFKDYGFFMPKDASGRTAIMEGIAKIEETSVADLQEYAKDANKSEQEVAAIKEPKTELTFEAKGVIIK